MATFYQAQITTVKNTPYDIFATVDEPAVRCQKLKAAFGVVQDADGKNIIAGEDHKTAEPMLAKMSVDQKLRLADILDAMVAGTKIGA